MDYKEMILELITSKEYKGCTLPQLLSALSVSKEERSQVEVQLKEMEEGYVLRQDDKKRYFLLETLGLFVGTLKKNQKGFGFVDGEKQSVYVSRYEITNCMDNDEVLVKIVVNADESVEGEIMEVISHSKHTMVGVIKKKDGKLRFLPDVAMPRQKIKITNAKAFKLSNDTKVQLHIDSFGKQMMCSIVKVLGYKYEPGIDVLSMLVEHGIESSFPKKVMKEASAISQVVLKEEKKGREDFTKDLIITIDGADSKDLDDAIGVRKVGEFYELGVHIADVSHYVKENSPLDQEAYARGTSVYVADRVVPMLPQVLSNGICSLNEHVERLTLSCIMKINTKGTIVSYRMVPSFIKTAKRMTYDGVNAIIERDKKALETYSSLVDMIDCALELSHILRNKKKQAGEIDFDKKESKLVVDRKGKVVDIVLRERKEAERLIEDFMICANECVASHSMKQEYPSLYRIHEHPDPSRLREFAGLATSMGFAFKADVEHVTPKELQDFLQTAKDSSSYDVLSTYLLRCMAKARYDSENLGHFGLALEDYTHFTSPIRRYPDLIVHRMMRAYAFVGKQSKQAMDEDLVKVEAAAKQSSDKERNAVEAERDVDQYKKCEYMKQYIGDHFDGIISSITKFGMFVELENTIEGLIHVSNMKDDHYSFDENKRIFVGDTNKKVYKMGEKVRVKLIDASKFKKQIDFEIEV